MFIEARAANLKKYVSLRKDDLCIILDTFLARHDMAALD